MTSLEAELALSRSSAAVVGTALAVASDSSLAGTYEPSGSTSASPFMDFVLFQGASADPSSSGKG